MIALLLFAPFRLASAAAVFHFVSCRFTMLSLSFTDGCRCFATKRFRQMPAVIMMTAPRCHLLFTCRRRLILRASFDTTFAFSFTPLLSALIC